MKFRMLLGAALASVICTNALAIEIHNGRLISHTETLTANPKAKFLEKKIDLKTEMIHQLLKKKAKAKLNYHPEFIGAEVHASTGVDIYDVPFVILGESHVYIENDYLSKNVYTIETIVDIFDPSTGAVTGVSCSDVVWLAQNGSVSVDAWPNFPLIGITAGYYTGEVQTYITREGGESEFNAISSVAVYIPSGKNAKK